MPETIFRFVWREGHRTDDDDSWKKLIDLLNTADADKMIARDEVKMNLRSNTEGAIARGVFGVPTIIAGDELFWGFDMTDMAAAYIRDSPAFEDAEMQRTSNLPVGVERPR